MDNVRVGTSPSWTLRRATGADAQAVAAMHVGAWRTAYRGIVPDPILDEMDVASRARRYSFDRRGHADPVTWIAADGEIVIGMVSIGPSRDDDLPELGEVQALYVEPGRWRSGAGSDLMATAEALLIEAGFREALLWVFRDNDRARRFYEATGWSSDGRSKDVQIGGREIAEVRYRKRLAGREPVPRT